MIIARYDTGAGERYRAWALLAIGIVGDLTCALVFAGSPPATPKDVLTAILLFAAFTAAAYFLPASVLLLVEVTETDIRWRHLFGGGKRPLSSVRSAGYSVRPTRGGSWPHITVKFTDRRSLQFTAKQPNTAVFLDKLKTVAPHAAVTPPPREHHTRDPNFPGN